MLVAPFLARFTNISKMILEEKVPLKERYVRYNQAKVMNKLLQKAIMNCSRLLNRYRKEKTEATRSAYKRQRNFCVKLLRKTKKEFYNNLNVKYITKNKLFWKAVKPSFTDKTLRDERITLVENNKVVSDESKLVEIFSKYFGNIVQNLGIDGLTNTSSDNDAVTIRQAIEKYQNHPSIKVIRENIDTTNNFSFDLINPECMSKIINNLDTSKATQQGDIPTKIIKDNKDLFSYFISASFNNAVNKGVFPNELKQADIKPIYKKESRNEKENYRPISILPNLSKIFERCMYDQLKDHFDKLLSKYQCGFRKGFSTQHCLLAMIEKPRKSLDSQERASADLFTDLSKAFVCLPHDLLITKLHAYGIKNRSLNLILFYLKNRKQRVRLNNTYREWIDILFGGPEGSILGPLLFNIFLCDLFLFLHDIPVANYADDNTPCCTG